MKNRKTLSIVLFALISVVSYFSYSKTLRFDMYSGSVRHEQRILTFKTAVRQEKNEISEVAERLDLLGKVRNEIFFNVDRNNIFYSSHYYSPKKSLYYDLVGLSKIIKSSSGDEDTLKEASSQFKMVWSNLQNSK